MTSKIVVFDTRSPLIFITIPIITNLAQYGTGITDWVPFDVYDYDTPIEMDVLFFILLVSIAIIFFGCKNAVFSKEGITIRFFSIPVRFVAWINICCAGCKDEDSQRDGIVFISAGKNIPKEYDIRGITCGFERGLYQLICSYSPVLTHPSATSVSIPTSELSVEDIVAQRQSLLRQAVMVIGVQICFSIIICLSDNFLLSVIMLPMCLASEAYYYFKVMPKLKEINNHYYSHFIDMT